MAKPRHAKRYLPTPAVALICALFAVACAVVCWWQLSTYEDNLVEIFAKQQDQYVKLAVDQINLRENREDKEIIEEILASIGTSNSQFWTLSKNNSLVFVKDVDDSDAYRSFSSKTYYNSQSAGDFFDGLTKDRTSHALIEIKGQEYIASGRLFSYDGSDYRLCLLTGKHVVIDQNAYLAARVNLCATVGLVLVLFVAGCVIMSLRLDRISGELAESQADLAASRRSIERLNQLVLGREAFDVQRSLFAMSTAPTLLEKLRRDEKLPAAFVSLEFEGIEDLNAFARAAQTAFDRSVFRFAAERRMLLVFAGSDNEAARYAMSLADGAQARETGVYTLEAGDGITWEQLAERLGIADVLEGDGDAQSSSTDR